MGKTMMKRLAFVVLFLCGSLPAAAQIRPPVSNFSVEASATLTGAAGGVLSGTYPNPGFATNPTFTGTLTVPATSTASGDQTIGAATGNVRVGTGSVPTIASGACGTGANGTIAALSRSNAGTIQIGAVATTTCTVVFATAMTTAPVCVITPADAAGVGATVLAYISANTVNGFVITGTALANVNFNYICL